MKYLLIILLLNSPFLLQAQKETETFDMIANGVVQMYNSGDYAGIYALYSPVLKKFQTAEEANKFYGSKKDNFGKIKSHKFLKFQQNYGVYSCEADKGTIMLRISIDQQKRLVAINLDKN
ncbi:DUF3887 domain-containing protein [Membranihabitans marinus]|uniref:DUF3887 domain-containing protein n=1 Tax=Membranihabitans marinus TaxID=1227546 RepID=UPI001F1FDB9F|nr:DUF3887 domain-containing protein [Membranihabitans marinus]